MDHGRLDFNHMAMKRKGNMTEVSRVLMDSGRMRLKASLHGWFPVSKISSYTGEGHISVLQLVEQMSQEMHQVVRLVCIEIRVQLAAILIKSRLEGILFKM